MATSRLVLRLSLHSRDGTNNSEKPVPEGLSYSMATAIDRPGRILLRATRAKALCPTIRTKPGRISPDASSMEATRS
jgi:hypothetical protein